MNIPVDLIESHGVDTAEFFERASDLLADAQAVTDRLITLISTVELNDGKWRREMHEARSAAIAVADRLPSDPRTNESGAGTSEANAFYAARLVILMEVTNATKRAYWEARAEKEAAERTYMHRSNVLHALFDAMGQSIEVLEPED